MNASCLRSLVRDASLLYTNDCGYRIDERQRARDIKRNVWPAQCGESTNCRAKYETHTECHTKQAEHAGTLLFGRQIGDGTLCNGDTCARSAIDQPASEQYPQCTCSTRNETADRCSE